jgi:hypothetical protein
MSKSKTKNIKVRDLQPKKDAKGGGGGKGVTGGGINTTGGGKDTTGGGGDKGIQIVNLG